VIHDWTFESVIVRLFRAFITTATAQQAVRKYAQIKYSQEEGVTAFHRELLLWAGRLAQYPDEYSFKRRLFNGLPSELRYHLALYEGVSAEQSTISAIVSKARHIEKTLISLRSGRKPDERSAYEAGTIGTRQRSVRSNDQSRARKKQPSKPSGKDKPLAL
jgi:hypothetical protein